MILNERFPAPIVLFGSGETLASSGKAHEQIASLIGERAKIAILETPAGFEPNSARVAGNVGEFLLKRLQNYSYSIDIIPARKKGTEFSPDNESILEPMIYADWIFMGPGSPTYAARQLRDSAALRVLSAKHRLGTPLTLASAAILAMSAYTLPVYEIYKVGEELHWQDGINFLKPYGLELIFIPHWNNSDGGTELDTSRCYMGRERFDKLIELLPIPYTLVGIDEHTSLMIDFSKQVCKIFGVGSVTIARCDTEKIFHSGEEFSLTSLGNYSLPNPEQLIDEHLMEKLRGMQFSVDEKDQSIPASVKSLIQEREAARLRKDWQLSDRLREQIQLAGWHVQDTPDGMRLTPNDLI
jgi:hypothetical protein